MIKIEDVEVFGVEKAIKGIRNAYKSWDKSDSQWETPCEYKSTGNCNYCGGECSHSQKPVYVLGDADKKLAFNLIKGGTPERKFLRMIHVQANITAPLYWWNQYDTYKVGTVANSESKMHTIMKKPFSINDFSIDGSANDMVMVIEESIILYLNHLRAKYLSLADELRNKDADKKDKMDALKTKQEMERIWRAVIQLLPESYNQMRTVDLNYEVLMQMYQWRRHHKLVEWFLFCSWIETLPNMGVFLCGIKE